jgi:molybdenum cofactor biosynthesis enzyme MoaA
VPLLHAEGLEWLRAEMLPYEELTRLAGVFCDRGVGKVRFTGGEPTARRISASGRDGRDARGFPP